MTLKYSLKLRREWFYYIQINFFNNTPSTLWVLEVAASALVRTNVNNTKKNMYEKVLQEVCEKFNDAEAFVRESIEELCNEKKYQQKR